MMDSVKRITSTQNPYVKQVVAIRKDGLVRQQEGVFFLEGIRAVDEALDRGVPPVDIIYVPRMFEEEPPVIAKAAAAGARLVSVSKDVYKKLADTINPIWVAGLFPIPVHKLPALLAEPKGIYLVASNVQDPGNLGSMWRSAACLGAEALLVSTPACGLYNGKVLRASAGAVFATPAIKARGKDIMSAFEEASVPVYGADIKGSMRLDALAGIRPVAVVLGHETQGIEPDIQNSLSGTFSIPMKNGMDSLNVAAASVVTLYELTRNSTNGND